MKNLLFIILFIANTFIICAQEKQISFDTQGKVMKIDQSFVLKNELFFGFKTEYNSRLFSLSDSTFSLETEFEQNGTILRNRKLLNANQLTQLQNEVDALIATRADKFLNQEGRTLMLMGNLGVALSYYGWAVPAILDLQETRAVIGTYMLTAGSGFLIPFFATRQRPVTYAQAALTFSGQYNGIIHGLLIKELLIQEDNERTSLGFALIGSVGNGILGYYYAGKKNLSLGNALQLNTYSSVGLLTGLAISNIAGLDRDTAFFTRATCATTLAFNMAGYYVGNLLANKYHIASGDPIVNATAGAIGAFYGITTITFIKSENIKFNIGVVLAGGLAGMTVGQLVTIKNDYTYGQGIVVSLGTVASSLIGTGTGFIMSKNADSRFLLSTTCAFGTAGYYLLSKYYGSRNNNKITSDKVQINFNPLGAISMASNNSSNVLLKYPVPLVSARVRF